MYLLIFHLNREVVYLAVHAVLNIVCNLCVVCNFKHNELILIVWLSWSHIQSRASSRDL